MPPLVLFGRYGTNYHCRAAKDGIRNIIVMDTSDHRAKCVDKKPELLGLGTNHNGNQIEIAKEQEQKWIDLCLDPQKSQHR